MPIHLCPVGGIAVTVAARDCICHLTGEATRGSGLGISATAVWEVTA